MKARIIAAGIMILALTASACDTAAKAPEPTKVTVTASSTGTGKAQTFSFDAPATMAGGRIDLTLDNADDTVHEVQLLSLKDGKTVADLEGSLGAEEFAIPDWLGIDGGIGATGGGETATAALNLAAGSYVFACFIDGHMVRGMLAPITVTDGETAALPETDGSIEAFDYGFNTDGLVAGEQTVTFENTGQQPHFIAVSRFERGTTLAEVEAEIERFQKDEKPQLGDPEEVGSIAAIDPGQAMTADLTLEEGYVYLFACWLPDRGSSGPPHFMMGMGEALEL